MPQIRHVPEDSNSIIPGRKVYFACHPEDHKLYFDEITAQLPVSVFLPVPHCGGYYRAVL